jgi:DNA-binding MarR family transcriptional regulator
MARTPRSRPKLGIDRELGDPEYRALGDFRRALREFLAFSDDAARENGLTSQQHQALLAIRSHSGPESMTIGELADCLMIRHHSAVGLVARLVERDLIVREDSQEDRRRVLLKLRPLGSEALKNVSLLNIGEYHRAADFLAEVLRHVRALNPGQTAKAHSAQQRSDRLHGRSSGG